jgi:hypothetical protein
VLGMQLGATGLLLNRIIFIDLPKIVEFFRQLLIL